MVPRKWPRRWLLVRQSSNLVLSQPDDAQQPRSTAQSPSTPRTRCCAGKLALIRQHVGLVSLAVFRRNCVFATRDCGRPAGGQADWSNRSNTTSTRALRPQTNMSAYMHRPICLHTTRSNTLALQQLASSSSDATRAVAADALRFSSNTT